jgi:hypothetical protein
LILVAIVATNALPPRPRAMSMRSFCKSLQATLVISFGLIGCDAGSTPSRVDASRPDCASGALTCGALERCVVTIYDELQCECLPGYHRGVPSPGAPVACVPNDRDECSLGVDDCDSNAVCTDLPLEYSCTCTAAYGGNGRSCCPVESRFTTTVLVATDTTTGREWERHEESAYHFWGTMAEASAYCSNLAIDGKTDWRLPTSDELEVVARVPGSGSVAAHNDCALPSGTVPSDWYWTSAMQPAGYGYVVSFASGSRSPQYFSEKANVRCTR